MFKVHTFTMKLGNYESFQGLSMTILGREDINCGRGRQT